MQRLKNLISMKHCRIKGGYAVFPKDWIVLNPEMAKQCTYAVVVVCRLVEYNVPHFIFFSNRRHGFDKEFRNKINELCCNAWPEYRMILQQQVEPIDDENGIQLNADEWMAAPQMEIFGLHVKGNPAYPADYVPPYGAMVVYKKDGIISKLASKVKGVA